MVIIPTTFITILDKRVDYLGPVFLEPGIALQSAFQHGSYTVLSFGPPERCSKRSEGVEEPIERRQRDFVDEMLCRDESAPIEGADPACEGIDEAVQLGIRKGFCARATPFRWTRPGFAQNSRLPVADGIRLTVSSRGRRRK